jgi:hypothetical protein
MSKLIHIRISPAAHKDLQREAAKDKRTLGQMARVLLEAALEARKLTPERRTEIARNAGLASAAKRIQRANTLVEPIRAALP